MINNKFDIRFYEDIIFYETPNIKVDLEIRDYNKKLLYSFKEIQLVKYYWFNFPDIHKHDEIYIEIFENENLIYEKLFFRNAELPYIKKEDLSIVLTMNKKIPFIIDYYSKYGKICFNESQENKYVLTLNENILNIVEVINKMFFDRRKKANLIDINLPLKKLDPSIW